MGWLLRSFVKESSLPVLRVHTFLSTVSRHKVAVWHIRGAVILPSDHPSHKSANSHAIYMYVFLSPSQLSTHFVTPLCLIPLLGPLGCHLHPERLDCLFNKNVQISAGLTPSSWCSFLSQVDQCQALFEHCRNIIWWIVLRHNNPYSPYKDSLSFLEVFSMVSSHSDTSMYTSPTPESSKYERYYETIFLYFRYGQDY